MTDRVDVKWFGPQVKRSISSVMTRRVKKAASQFRRKVVKNISIPVVRYGSYVLRSSPGEFPRTDTARLRRDIFWKMVGPHEAVIGTTLDYGAILEFNMSRSFLRRTLREEASMIKRILLHGPPSFIGKGRRGRR